MTKYVVQNIHMSPAGNFVYVIREIKVIHYLKINIL